MLLSFLTVHTCLSPIPHRARAQKESDTHAICLAPQFIFYALILKRQLQPYLPSVFAIYSLPASCFTSSSFCFLQCIHYSVPSSAYFSNVACPVPFAASALWWRLNRYLNVIWESHTNTCCKQCWKLLRQVLRPKCDNAAICWMKLKHTC